MLTVWLVFRFGQNAGNYELVISAARHYWNAIKPFIVEPIERELLKEPLETVLECIAAVAASDVGKEDEVQSYLGNLLVLFDLTHQYSVVFLMMENGRFVGYGSK